MHVIKQMQLYQKYNQNKIKKFQIQQSRNIHVIKQQDQDYKIIFNSQQKFFANYHFNYQYKLNQKTSHVSIVVKLQGYKINNKQLRKIAFRYLNKINSSQKQILFLMKDGEINMKIFLNINKDFQSIDLTTNGFEKYHKSLKKNILKKILYILLKFFCQIYQRLFIYKKFPQSLYQGQDEQLLPIISSIQRFLKYNQVKANEKKVTRHLIQIYKKKLQIKNQEKQKYKQINKKNGQKNICNIIKIKNPEIIKTNDPEIESDVVTKIPKENKYLFEQFIPNQSLKFQRQGYQHSQNVIIKNFTNRQFRQKLTLRQNFIYRKMQNQSNNHIIQNYQFQDNKENVIITKAKKNIITLQKYKQLHNITFSSTNKQYLILQLLQMIDFLQKIGIIYFDYTKQNIFIGKNLFFMLKNFQNSLLRSEICQQQKIRNILKRFNDKVYKMPEISKLEQKAYQKADLYSILLIYYQLQFKQLPFTQKSPQFRGQMPELDIKKIPHEKFQQFGFSIAQFCLQKLEQRLHLQFKEIYQKINQQFQQYL